MSDEFARVIPFSPQPHRGIYKKTLAVEPTSENKALINCRNKELETLYKIETFLHELKVEGLKLQLRENFIELNYCFNISSKEYNDYLKALEEQKEGGKDV